MGIEEGYVRRYKKGDAIPDGAIFLEKDEISKIQKKRLELLKKEKKSSVLPLIYAPAVMATATSTGGLYFAHHFRQVFKLGTSGKAGLGLFFTSLVLPSGLIFGLYSKMIVPSVIKGEVDCRICFETKLGLLQLVLGVAYPISLSWLFSAMEARALFTYPVPYYGSKRPEFMTFFRETVPKATPMSMVVIGSMSIAMAVGSQMQSCYEETFLNECDSMLVQKRDFYGRSDQ
ncbi:uncharacterized protein LOC110465312 [Mizuhopecten yessoensis]|uniref:Transmembrane protein n=1 Tax=Mizuhopecten yessoensis TaxID=6573 RepID=A0A210PRX5_MIZYE|nr:uncharacterized protein LOC110465312 [Mizuhopecten yessoensis]XP_021376715.1 uncharacterized protein LOC110465312 [Mizuhopecten yessoensis]XP_021376716.1 uncharacterized protein LOC110465312 [Mizuhopecten yessoensis]XP_021376717.1 uncharacterized protein LOC110465312 [Mizuhopecten yessoensis]OWF39204.1 hypothetical protein KP79_PYT20335 [Mizuhopecten yessoensis]